MTPGDATSTTQTPPSILPPPVFSKEIRAFVYGVVSFFLGGLSFVLLAHVFSVTTGFDREDGAGALLSLLPLGLLFWINAAIQMERSKPPGG